MKVIRKLLVKPARRIGRTVINLLILDIASALYWYAKHWFREPKTKSGKKEEVLKDDIWPNLKSRRRW